ncbi:endonuclease/exonuclease/phosphatase family protein [Phycicoccus sonneratiae]|uniref:Endonuclease/exonuclease/phosphatase family protein n=1 Tax=Phycicoccus sonneratiae TaxID=2807628 RepID=A0ABS2CSH6_9MICO|nr:endonuclease/exonuclease/phosphatase family protein [Phycicoccus sonneraticus]MBM6402069.1 endonuclease/exonuclease/phosphatase family protein [Phycicoccus sonneraticus]
MPPPVRTLLAVLALVAGLAGPAFPQGTAAAAATTHRVATFNMCGYGSTGGCGGTTTQRVEWMAQRVVSDRIGLLTVNEVCEPVVEALRRRLGALGVTVHTAYQQTFPARRGRCAGASSGNAVVSRTSLSSVRRVTFAAQASGAVERRGVLCAQTVLGGATEVCTAHLLPGAAGAAVRRQQVLEALRAASAPGRPLVLAGDLNEVPPATMLDPLYASRYGAGSRGTLVEPASTRSGAPCRCGAGTRGTAKLDYVFGSGATFAPGTTAVRDSPWSDHHLLLADLIRS